MPPSRFRPCIDLHDGVVKQIVGGTLSDSSPSTLQTNFVASCVRVSSPIRACHPFSSYSLGICSVTRLPSSRHFIERMIFREDMLSSSDRGMTRRHDQPLQHGQVCV